MISVEARRISDAVTKSQTRRKREKPDIETFQVPFESDRLLDIYNAARPARVLEIGSWRGGTLWHWLQTGAAVVSVDDAMRDSDRWQQWSDAARADLFLLQGDSRDPDIVERARTLGPYGFVFIDADHTYDAVKADWLNYSPLVEPGGIVAFHDIIERPDYGVSRVWAEVKAEHPRTVEIVDASVAYHGIGVVWL